MLFTKTIDNIEISFCIRDIIKKNEKSLRCLHCRFKTRNGIAKHVHVNLSFHELQKSSGAESLFSEGNRREVAQQRATEPVVPLEAARFKRSRRKLALSAPTDQAEDFL